MRLRRWIVALAALAAQPALAHAGSLRKLWEVDLRKEVHATDGLPEFPVFALRFSPNGKRLAIIGDVYNTSRRAIISDLYGAGRNKKSRLVVIDVDHPAAGVGEFEVGFGIHEDEHGRAELNFGWAPSGGIIYAGGTVTHLSDGTTCELPYERGIFVADDLALSAQGSRVGFYSPYCETQGYWDVPGSWLISDVSADRGLLSVMSTISAAEWEGLIVDPLSRRILQRWPGNVGAGVWRFANGGKAVCQSGAVLESDSAPAVCRDVDTGQIINETRSNGIEPVAVASRATRMVVSDYRRRKSLFSYEYSTTFHGRIVWDFGAGKALASWQPESERYPNVFNPGAAITAPFHFAISPDGNYIAEGGNGIIRLYKIEP